MYALRMIGVPTLIYLGVTLVVPWMNGAAANPRYVEHAVTVAWICVGFAAVASGALTLVSRLRAVRDPRREQAVPETCPVDHGM